MTKRLGVLLIAVVSLILQGCAVTSTDNVVKPGTAKSGFMGLSKTAEVTVDYPKTLKQQSGKVIIGSFKVGFITDGKAQAVAKGGMFSSTTSYGKASAIVHLEGLTRQDMQAVTDEMYQKFVSDLQAKGYTVVSAAELANEPTYAALQGAGTAEPQENIVVNLALDGKTSYFAPTGMNVIYFLGEKKSAFNISMDTLNKANALSDATGAQVLAVHYLVNFAGAESHGGFTSSASVKVGQVLKVVAGSSMTNFAGKKTPQATLKLGQPVFSMEPFCTIDNITSAGARTLRTATNVATAILGGGTSQVEEYNFNADPVKYKVAMADLTEKTNALLIGKLAENR